MRRALLLALCCAGCGAGTSLEGSLSEDVPLAFDQVQVQRTAGAIALVYLRAVPGGTGNDIVFKLTANTTGVALDGAAAIDLAEKLGTGTRGQAERIVSGDGRSALPAISRGALHFSAAPASGASASGSFNVLFAAGGSVGAGKTVFGDFSATVQEVQ